jgi:glycosidase
MNTRKLVFNRLFISCLSLITLITGALAPTPVLARSVEASHTPNPSSVTIAGSLQSELGCPDDWQPDCANTHLTYDAGDDVWQGTFSLPAGSYEYKAALNNAWDENYGLHAGPGGANIPLTAPGGDVKFYYDHKSHWVTDNKSSVIAVAPGSFQSELGCSGDWDPGCLRSWLQDIDGDGIYTFETTALPAGTYAGKVALNETWDVNYGQGGVFNGADISFTVPTDNAKVTFRYDSVSHILTISAGHGHDNNVEYDGLGHNSRDSLYRVPFGAVTPNTPVTLRFRTYHNDVTNVTIRLYDTAVGHEDREPMTLAARNVDCYAAGLPPGSTCDYWQFTYTPTALGTVYYRFIITDGTSTAYYSDNAPRYGGVGQATPTEADNGFRLNVVDSNFPVVGWMQNGVMYQIFPDRFRNGGTDNDPKPTDPRYDYPAPTNATPQQIQAAANAQILLKKWNELPEGYCRDYVSPATPCTESPQGRDYFGGDLKGVDDKLDYLKRLGVTIIYFNPIFESGSNHGYDTRDFLSISRYFGTSGFFKKLVTDANARGIKIVLDGVFNHLSSDSPFFDRYHHYTSVGACEDISSPYRSWFFFHDVTPGSGVCADSQNRPNSAMYDGWAGFDSIPVIAKRDPSNTDNPYAPVAQYFYQDPSLSVAGYWLKQGAAGWRFDVMTDPSFPTKYWEQLRTITKGIKPDEILIAEAWQWFDNLPLTHGNEADTAMGYRFRNAALGLLGAVDNKGFPEENNPNLPPSTFANRMMSIREDYADATYYTFQNLLDSHDTARVLWSVTPGEANREAKELNAANLAVGKAKQAIAALVQMTVPGTPTIYYGDEVSLTGASDPDDRRAFPWKLNANGSYVQDPKDTKYYAAAGDHATFDWYQKLIAIRQANPVFRNGVLTFLLTDDANKTLAYAMRKDNNLAIVVINRNETSAQTIQVPTAPYLRNGVTLKNALDTGSVTTGGGSFQVSLGALKSAIFIMNAGQDITGPAAPTQLTATANNGLTSTVSLNWTGSAGSASYNVYRSPVQGGGYVKIGTTNSTTYDDTSVNNGTTYYYVVRGLDAPGNEGANSNEANATPAFPIGYAVLQWPKTIDQAITANYTTVYGQIYVAGLTDAGGDPDAILAQVGFGAPGSDPAGWGWVPMSYNSGHTGDNNYEYQGGIRADAVGTYDYLVRFSDDGGRTWVYGDQDGYYPGEPGTDMPGVMTITASADTTAPSAPVASIDFSASSLVVSWTASTDPDDAVAEYRLYRGTTSGGESSTAIAIVSGSTLSYVDTAVNVGQTYYYTVKAFDTSLNASQASNEVSHSVEPKVVQVTFRVKVPAFTPPGDFVYITGQSQGVSPDPLCGYCGGNASTIMTETAPGSHIWEITLPIPDGTPIQYKYTRSTYDYVEEWGTITGFTNRVAGVQANGPNDLTQLFDDTSDANPDDNHKAVQNWRDGLVTAASSSATAVTFTFNWDVKSDSGGGTDFSNTIVVVNSVNVAVPGTITHDATAHTLTFTPASTLATGTYTATVDHVISLTQQNDGIKIRTPYIFSFTVN